MTAPLSVSRQRLLEMNEASGLERAFGQATVIAVSGVWQKDMEEPRFKAVLQTVSASQAADVVHLIMLDNRSQEGVVDYLLRHGAIVVVIDGEVEGGLGRPYVIAAQLIEAFAPNEAIMVKFEGEKPVFENQRNVAKVLEVSHWADVASGERTAATWASMPPFQVLTEFWLGSAIGDMLEVARDTPSGVIALTSNGRRCFIDNVVDNDWSYLFRVPLVAYRSGLTLGQFPVDFRYADMVVAEETGNARADQKRLDQIDAMLGKARELYDDSGSDACALQVMAFREVLQLQLNRVG